MALQKINTPDRNTQLIQDNMDKALQPLQNMPFVGGSLLKAVALTAAQDNLIQHGLGRIPQLFMTGNLNQNTAVWTQASPLIAGQSSNTQVINLRCTVSCTVVVWIN